MTSTLAQATGEAAVSPQSVPGRALVVCDQWLGSNGYAGMRALRRAGWSVHVVAEWDLVPVRWRSWPMRALARAVRPLAVREFNDELVRVAARFRPEMLLIFKGTFVEARALRQLSEMGVRCYCFFPDVSASAHGPYLPAALPRYDHVFTTKRFGLDDLSVLGVRSVSLLHHAFDPELHRPIVLGEEDRRRYACDVSFIGTWSPKKERYLTRLRVTLPTVRLRIWGAQWERAASGALRGAIAGHTVEGQEYVRAIAGSTINLALLSEQRPGASAGDEVTSRTFHIPASGGFMLHESTNELRSLLEEGREVACFGDERDLPEAVELWLSRPTERLHVAHAGERVVRDAHSWDDRIREILALHAAAVEPTP